MNTHTHTYTYMHTRPQIYSFSYRKNNYNLTIYLTKAIITLVIIAFDKLAYQILKILCCLIASYKLFDLYDAHVYTYIRKEETDMKKLERVRVDVIPLANKSLTINMLNN